MTEIVKRVAFLRGMNLGRRRITNEALAQAFTDLGFEAVQVFLASGNVVFSSDEKPSALEGRIAEGLEASLGYPVLTFVRTDAEVRSIAGQPPFDGARGRVGGKPQVIFLPKPPPAAKRRKAMELATEDDRLVFSGAQVLWLPSGGISDSELDLDAIGKLVGPTTVRTHNTVVRLAKKFLAP